MISNKLVKHNAINSKEFLSLLKHEINHDDSNNNDGNINHDLNTISRDDNCIQKDNAKSYQIKCMNNL